MKNKNKKIEENDFLDDEIAQLKSKLGDLEQPSKAKKPKKRLSKRKGSNNFVIKKNK